MRLPLCMLSYILTSSLVFRLHAQEPQPESRPIRVDTTLINDLPPEKREKAAVEQGQTGQTAHSATDLPHNLADALTRALRSNPDVQLAIAHLDEIQAQRDQTRFKMVELLTRAAHEYRLASAAHEVGRDDPRAPGLDEARARLAYLLGAGNDQMPEEQSRETSAEILVDNLAQNLGKAIERALIANPDLRLADAKVREARAELNQVKLATAQKVTIAFARWQFERSQLNTAEKQPRGAMPASEIRRLRLELAEGAADLSYLLGNGATPPSDEAETVRHPPPLSFDSSVPAAAAPATTRPGIPEQYAELMKKPVRVKISNFTIKDVLAQWNDQTGGELRTVEHLGPMGYDLDIAGEVPLATALEMLADLTDSAFVFRDYGLLAVPRQDAWKYSGATIPADAPLTAGNR